MSRTELAGTAACAFTLTLWNAAARGGLTFGALPFFTVFCLACVHAGRFCARVFGPEEPGDFPTVFVLGYFVLNTALFVVHLASPLSIADDSLLVLAAFMALPLIWPPARPPLEPADDPGRFEAGLLALGLGLIGATFWCCDSIVPEGVTREGVLLKPFFDSYFHSCEIRIFRDAPDFTALGDFRMSGEPLVPYHLATYITPALASAVTGTPPYEVFGSFQVPFGEILTALAAFSVVSYLWGGGAGVAATLFVVCLPDASRHGMLNYWMSARWIQQVNPSGLYGVALLALAWRLMFAGCRTGRLVPVALSFAAVLAVSQYKAQLFVAAALLAALYPGVFFRGADWRWKVAWLVFALAAFVSVAGFSQRFRPVPVLRLDGSSVLEYMRFIGNWTENAAPKRAYLAHFQDGTPWPRAVAWGAWLLFYGSLGLFGIANLVLALGVLGLRLGKRPVRVELEYAWFPVLIAVNYLVMSLGLALDTRNPGHQEELRHRPLVWAYFVAAAWAGGLGYRLLLDRPARRSPRLRTALIALAFSLLVIPLRMGPNVQVGGGWGWVFTWRAYPRGLYECARFIRENGNMGELAQASKDDPRMVFCALSEHPPYAVAYFDGKPDEVLSGRLKELAQFREMTDAESIRQFALERNIRWYVLEPNTDLRWPKSFLSEAVFTWKDHRVYSFVPPKSKRWGPTRTAQAQPSK